MKNTRFLFPGCAPALRARRAVGTAFSIAIAFALLGAASEARAQTQPQAGRFSLDRFDPSERGSEWFALDTLDLRGHLRWNLGVVGDGAIRPLALYDSNNDVRTSVVSPQIFVHAGASLVLWEHLRLGLNVPVAVWQDGSPGSLAGMGYSPPDHSGGIGDIRLGADLRLFGKMDGAATMTVGAQVYLPTGSRNDYTGDGQVRVQPRVILAGELGAFLYSAKLGFMYRGYDSKLDNSTLGSEVTFGAAAGLRVANRNFVIGPEVFGSTVVTSDDAFFKTHGTPVEGLIGAHYTFAEQFRIGAGVGTGLTQGYGAPEARWLVSLERVAPFEKPVDDRDHDGIVDSEDACPDVPGVHSNDPTKNGCPPDRDGDGILDSDDACVDVPGVRTDDPKTNGCPPDRDHDGIVDSADACPDVAGVRTDDPKTNGCPPDRDHDGVLDADDACVDVPGVHTDDPKTNGCPPDPDRDKDTVPNEQDACPDTPGKPDPDPKKNGCPMAFVQAGQIRILEQVKFVTNSAAIVKGKDSEPVLEAVLGVLNDHVEIKHLRVEGHTDDQGKAAYNKTLSKKRAESVVAWLVSHGIDKSRLSAEGYGMERPISSNSTPEGRRDNRRVEFHIDDDAAAKP